MTNVEELERRMRPGALSTGGFLGEDERLEEVLEADRLTLTELGLTPGQITEPLERLLGAVDIFVLEADYEGHNVPETALEAARAAVDAAEEMFGRVITEGGRLSRVLVGGRFQVTQIVYAGIQECPWSQDVLTRKHESGVTLRLCGAGSEDWSIRDVQRGLQMRGPSLITHLIRDHGFFEGFESPYRVDPRALAELLQLGPFAEPT